jgi:6-phosphogluconolactonase (cycloisomerase 2 family)
MHPSGKFLYAVNSGEDDVSVYAISASGALTEAAGRTPVGTAPTLLALDGANGFLYVGNSGSFSISVFSINSSTGLLTAVGNPFPIGLVPINMKLSPSGGVLYVAGGGNPGIIEAFGLSQGVPCTVGSACYVPNSPFYTGNSPYGMAVSASGGFLYTANKVDASISEFAINSDGSLTEISGSPIGETYGGPISLLIDKSGTYLYVANQGSTNLGGYSIGADGTITLLTTSPFGTGASPSVLATDPGGKFLFVGSGSSIQSFSLDTSDGVLTSVETYSVTSPNSIAITP